MRLYKFIIDFKENPQKIKLLLFYLSFAYCSFPVSGVQHLLHLKSKSKILRPIEIMGFFYEFFCQIQGNNLL